MTDSLTILVDTREQRPLTFGSDVIVETVTLATGDYSARGIEQFAAIERKSLPDLIASMTFERERFDREIERLRALSFALVVVEAPLDDVIEWRYHSKASPSAIVGSVASMMARGVPFLFADSPRNAAIVVERLLRKLVKHRALAAEATA